MEDYVSPSNQNIVNTDGAEIFEAEDISGGMHDMAVNSDDGAMRILPNPTYRIFCRLCRNALHSWMT